MRIFHPRPQAGRQKFIGVEFRGGVAEVEALHPERRLALEMHGYAIQDDDGSVTIPGDWTLPLPEAIDTTADSVPLDETKPLSDYTVAELREIADFEGVSLPAKAKKFDIVEAILEAGSAEVDGRALDTGEEPRIEEGGVLETPAFITEAEGPEAFFPYAANED